VVRCAAPLVLAFAACKGEPHVDAAGHAGDAENAASPGRIPMGAVGAVGANLPAAPRPSSTTDPAEFSPPHAAPPPVGPTAPLPDPFADPPHTDGGAASPTPKPGGTAL
jgi:hypothetical protein